MKSIIQIVDRQPSPSLLPILRSQQQGEILALLLGDPDLELSLTEIADRLSLSRNTVTELCSRAEEVGLLSRDDAEEDRRLVYLELTREAERRLFGALNEMDEHRGDISKAFDELTRSVRQARR